MLLRVPMKLYLVLITLYLVLITLFMLGRNLPCESARLQALPTCAALCPRLAIHAAPTTKTVQRPARRPPPSRCWHSHSCRRPRRPGSLCAPHPQAEPWKCRSGAALHCILAWRGANCAGSRLGRRVAQARQEAAKSEAEAELATHEGAWRAFALVSHRAPSRHRPQRDPLGLLSAGCRAAWLTAVQDGKRPAAAVPPP